MTAKYAVIADGVVENVIVANPGFSLPGKILVQSDQASAGDLWGGETFTRPPPVEPVPDEITNAQARSMLLTLPSVAENPSLFHDVDGYLRARKDLSTQDAINWQFWEYGNTVPRHGALMTSLAAGFGYTDPAALDALFIAASKLDA